jgi:ABC-2 type transport system permease protein
MLICGGLPRFAVTVAWLGLVVSVAGGLLGDVLGLPRAVRELSPFSHVPAVRAAELNPLPILVLVLVAAALTASA